mgnify:CR=1 FL=1
MKKDLYYMTQYANYMTDQGYYESMSEQLKELDREQLSYLCKELAPKVSDIWNEILFDILYYVKPEDLDTLIEAWEFLADEEFRDFLNVLGLDYESYLSPDSYIYDYDTLEEMADNEFKTSGINASARYWYDELDASYNYFVFNGYQNGFHCYNTFDDALFDFIELDSIKNDIIDYFK